MRGTLIAANRTRALDHEAGLYFCGHMTQGEVAKRIGVPSTKAHRLIARATRKGLVRMLVGAFIGEPPMNLLDAVVEALDDGIRFVLAGTVNLDLRSEAMVPGARDASPGFGHAMAVVRPHALQLVREGLPARFVANQWIGDQSRVAVSLAEQTIAVVEHERFRLRSGEEVALAVEARDLHVFNSLNEAALSRAGELA